MYVQNAANGHPGLPACGWGASSPTTSAPPPAGSRCPARDMLPLALLFGLCLTTGALRYPLPRVVPFIARLAPFPARGRYRSVPGVAGHLPCVAPPWC